MTPGNNRRAFLSSVLLAGGSVAAFGESFRQDGRPDPPRGDDTLFEHIQRQLVATLRAAKARGAFLTAEDAATGAAYMRICAVHARGLDLDRVASEALARRVASVGRDTLISTPADLLPLRAALRQKGLLVSERLERDLSRAGVAARTAALDAVREGRTSIACDRIAEALEAAAPRLATDQRSIRLIGVADEGWCNFVIGQWSMYLALAWYIASFQDPALQQFLEALWAGFSVYDTMFAEQC